MVVHKLLERFMRKKKQNIYLVLFLGLLILLLIFLFVNPFAKKAKDESERQDIEESLSEDGSFADEAISEDESVVDDNITTQGESDMDTQDGSSVINEMTLEEDTSLEDTTPKDKTEQGDTSSQEENPSEEEEDTEDGVWLPPMYF